MNHIEGRISHDNPDLDQGLTKKNFKEVVSSALKNEVSSKNLNGAQEHLGHVIITKESSERKASKVDSRLSEISLTKVDTMNRAELIDISGSIEIDGSNLRRIFETRLIGENGLRRLIKEYLNGGDLKKLLRQEILEREIDFERDPVMRDMASSSKELEDAVSSENPSKLAELVEKAEASLSGSSEELAFYKAKADYEVEQMARQHSKLRRIDIIMAVVITLLIIMIVILFLTRTN